MKTLLAIIRDPHNTDGFLEHVAGMALDFKAKVHVLYAQNANHYLMSSAGATAAGNTHLQQNMQELVEDVKAILGEHINKMNSGVYQNVEFTFTAQLGELTSISDHLMEEHNVDMVVIEGESDNSFLNETNSTMELIRHFNCPVWVIPAKSVYFQPKEIVYATDYKENDILNLKKLIALTKPFIPYITLLHISTEDGFNERIKEAGFLHILQEKLNYNRLNVKNININHSQHLIEGITDYAQINKVDLIVVLKENKSFLERLFKENHTKEIVKRSMIPVLVFHEDEISTARHN